MTDTVISPAEILAAGILIVDDQEANVTLLEKMLRAAGYTSITSTRNPREVAELHRKRRYTLILLDLQMPGWDGFQVMEELKSVETGGYLPVLVVTAQPDHKLRALKAGARDFVSKPFDLAEVLVRVRNMLEVRLLNLRTVELYDRVVLGQKASDQLLHIFRSGPSAMCVKTVAAGRIIDANEEYCRFFGCSRADVIGRSVLDRNHWVQVEHREAVLRRLLEEGSVRNYETKQRRGSGEARDVLISLEFIELAGESEPVVISMFTDITERKESERLLRQSEERFRTLFELGPIAVYSCDRAGRVQDYNRRAVELWGGEPADGGDGGGFNGGQRLYTADGALLNGEDNPMADVLNGKIPGAKDLDLLVGRTDGSRIAVTVSIAALKSEGGDITGVINCFQDVSDRKKAEESSKENAERFRELAENIQDVFWLTDPGRSQMLYVSPAYEKVWGRPCASLYSSPATWAEAIHPEDRARVLEAVRTKQLTGSYDEEYRIARPNGSVSWIRDRAFPIRNTAGEVRRVAGLASDITDRKENERQMFRAQRMESIGTLAGGVAHDLNNALAPILMGTQLLRMTYPVETELIDAMENSANRGADMVRQLLTFAKGRQGARVLVQPRYLLRELETIIRNTLPKNIQLRTACARMLPTVLGDATQLHQVLLNLCVNARDAMPEGGVLTMEAKSVEIDDAAAAAHPGARPGAHVVLRVTDTGTGIPPEILDRIFEPFFSTKGPEKGTGLGLSTVIGITKGHAGFVEVHSAPGAGSTFEIYLPASNSGAPEHVPASPKARFRGDGETALIVDDDLAVRQVMRSVLTALGFKPILASDGAEALLQAEAHRADLRLVITDLHMPRMDGLSLARVLKPMLPGAGIIVASGRFEDRDRTEFQALGINTLLEKPFTQDDLASALESVFQK